MINKKSISVMALLVTGLLLITAIQGCKKYPENMGVSLRSRTERVANTWKVENYQVNGKDYTSLVSNYSETFTNGGSYSYNWGSVDGSGSWVFQNNDEEIKLTGKDDQANRTLTILKLEEKTFWYTYMDGGDRHELHLIGN